ncbi:MAG: hypothetical protein ACOYMB_01410 [Patescibacteria group bacterium]
MNQRLRFGIISGLFSLLALFSFGLEAKAVCVWADSCNSTYYLDTLNGTCGAINTKPKPNSRCCCDGSGIENATAISANFSTCSWQNDLLGKPCGLLAEGASVQGDSFCADKQKTGTDAKCCCLPQIPLVASKPAAVLNNPFDNLSIPIPGLYKSLSCKYDDATKSYVCPKVNCETGADGTATCEVPWIGQYLIAIYNYALIIIGSIAAVTVMAGGILWLISGSNASRMKVAKEMIVGSISGLVIMFSSYMIISVVNPTLLIFKPISIGYIEEAAPDYSDSSLGAGDNPFQAGCDDFKKNKSTKVCASYGTKKPANLVSYQGKQISEELKIKIEKALKCVSDKNGGKVLFRISAGSRTAEKSLSLYNDYISGKSKIVAAAPCCSNHLSGNAVDLNRTDGVNMIVGYSEKTKAFINSQWDYVKKVGLVDCMTQNGIPGGKIAKEPWHWSLTGN